MYKCKTGQFEREGERRLVREISFVNVSKLKCASTLDVVTISTHLSIGHNVSIKKADHVPLGDLPVFLVRLAKQEQ